MTSRSTFNQKLRWMFSLYDANNDGNVTKDEMMEIMQVNIKIAQCKDDNLSANKLKNVIKRHVF